MEMVAKEAGVERSTVSRVLGGDFGPNNQYRPETVARIRAAAKRLGYRRSLPALALKTGKTMTVGLIVADISVQFFSDIVSYLDRLSGKAGYKLVISNSREDPEIQTAAIHTMREHMVDGLIICPVSLSEQHVNELLRYEGEIVLFDRTGPHSHFPTVTVENADGARQAVERLYDLGHRDIAAVVGRRTDPSAMERVRGFREALSDRGLAVPKSRIICDAMTAKLAEAASMKLLAMRKRPTAVFTGEAGCTIGLMIAARRLGLRIPEDLSIIGFDDLPLADLLDPPIDVIRQPAIAIADESFRILLSRMKRKSPPESEQVVLPVELVVRASCAAPRRV